MSKKKTPANKEVPKPVEPAKVSGYNRCYICYGVFKAHDITTFKGTKRVHIHCYPKVNLSND